MANCTLLLDNLYWDLVLDATGDIAVAQAPYQLAQDAACAMRLFQGELWYDTSQGVPYWQQVLGTFPPLPLVKTYLQNAALTVPGVTSATCYITDFTDRKLSGQVQITDANGNVSIASF